jgi:hypothetical protein
VPEVGFTTDSFAANNPFGVANAECDVSFILDELLHAAVTAGHDYDWSSVLGAELAGFYEMLWKAHAFLMCVREESFAKQNNASVFVDRLVSTQRFWQLDPSEKQGASYHLGMLLAVAWARRVLQVPWLLHIDVYRRRLNPAFQPGNSRPDLIGRDGAGRWVVLECKGRSTPPNVTAKTKAKDQARRVTSVGGQAPHLAIAFFSFFGPDKGARGRPKPWVIKGLVIDPEPDTPEEPIELPELSAWEFYRLYYEPITILFSSEQRVTEEQGSSSRYIEALDLTIRIPTDLRQILLSQQYGRLVERTHTLQPGVVQTNRGASTGDGLIVEGGARWRQRFKAER